MAQQVSVMLLCDLHGGDVEAVETVSFGLGNSAYEIDVCAADAKELRSKLGPFMSMPGARLAAPGGGPACGGPGAHRRDPGLGRGAGRQISERGRIPASVVAEYEQSH